MVKQNSDSTGFGFVETHVHSGHPWFGTGAGVEAEKSVVECLLSQSRQHLMLQKVQSLPVDSLSVVVVAVKKPVGCPFCFEWYEKEQIAAGELERFAEIGQVENPLSQERAGSAAAASLVSFACRLILKDPELS